MQKQQRTQTSEQKRALRVKKSATCNEKPCVNIHKTQQSQKAITFSSPSLRSATFNGTPYAKVQKNIEKTHNT